MFEKWRRYLSIVFFFISVQSVRTSLRSHNVRNQAFAAQRLCPTRRRCQPEKRCVLIDFRDLVFYSASETALSFSGGRSQTFGFEMKLVTFSITTLVLFFGSSIGGDWDVKPFQSVKEVENYGVDVSITPKGTAHFDYPKTLKLRWSPTLTGSEKETPYIAIFFYAGHDSRGARGVATTFRASSEGEVLAEIRILRSEDAKDISVIFKSADDSRYFSVDSFLKDSLEPDPFSPPAMAEQGESLKP